jgi:hypothetical protein
MFFAMQSDWSASFFQDMIRTSKGMSRQAFDMSQFWISDLASLENIHGVAICGFSITVCPKASSILTRRLVVRRTLRLSK